MLFRIGATPANDENRTHPRERGSPPQLISKIRENPKYRDKAGWFRKVLEETDGLQVAADIVERAFEDRFSLFWEFAKP
jgi:hypothetical protein